MPSLLSGLDPEILSLLGGQGTLLGGGAQSTSLLGALPQRAPEGLLDKLFGTGPDDPRTQAMSAFSVGLMRGDGAEAFAGANRAFAEARDRAQRQRIGNLGLLKTGLELQGMVDSTKRQRGIRGDLEKLYQGEAAAPDRPNVPLQFDPSSGGQFGPQSVGGSPMPGQPLQAPAGLGVPQIGMQGQGATGYMGGRGEQPGLPGQRRSVTDDLSERLVKEAQIYARWGDYERADSMLKQAAQFQPEVKEIGVQMYGGKPVQVITYKNGRQQVSDFGPAPKTHWLDTGGAIQPVDEYTLEQRGRPFAKSMTPSDRIAAGNLDVSRRRLALDESTPQYVQTEGGWIALPKRPGPGPIVGQNVTGPDGRPLGPPLKQIPPSANAGIVTNMQNLNKAKQALALLQGGDVGSSVGDTGATGWKGFLPNTVLNRVDPAGVDTRAAISDLGSLVIHDRSGAAVTVSESPRLMPFIPVSTDDRATAEKKLSRFIDVFQQETDALAQTYSKEQGYRPNPILENNKGGQRQPDAAVPLPLNPSASSLRPGQTYKLPNGVTATWDGLQFKVRK